jgi:hypothetical protein
MTFQDLFKNNPTIWMPIADMLDNVLTSGINDRFTRAEREYMFAHFSKENSCDFCYEHHIDFAYDLGYNSSITVKDLIDEDALENIFWIKNIALLVNNAIKEYDIKQINSENKKLKNTTIKEYGYKYKKNIRS